MTLNWTPDTPYSPHYDFLSKDDLELITGRKSRLAQEQWLLAHGWIYELNALGHPIISRRYAHKRLGFVQGTGQPAPLGATDWREDLKKVK